MMIEWIRYKEDLIKQKEYYQTQKDALVRSGHVGKWIACTNNVVVGTFENRDDAAITGMRTADVAKCKAVYVTRIGYEQETEDELRKLL